jgi:hypothetical protein
VNGRKVEALLWSVALAGAVVTGVRLRAGSRDTGTTPIRPVLAAGDLRRYDEDVLMSAADSIEANDPFRLDSHSPQLLSDATSVPTTPASSLPLPRLTLGGVTGGPPWRAVVDGFPERIGSVVVGAGDTIGVLHVRSIGRDTVVIASPDTTWTLTVR